MHEMIIIMHEQKEIMKIRLTVGCNRSDIVSLDFIGNPNQVNIKNNFQII